MIDTTIEQRIQTLRNTHTLVDDAVTREPALLDILYRAARDTSANRWSAYERYKHEALPYIGFTARFDTLATSQHYSTFLQAIDAAMFSQDDDTCTQEHEQSEVRG